MGMLQHPTHGGRLRTTICTKLSAVLRAGCFSAIKLDLFWLRSFAVTTTGLVLLFVCMLSGSSAVGQGGNPRFSVPPNRSTRPSEARFSDNPTGRVVLGARQDARQPQGLDSEVPEGGDREEPSLRARQAILHSSAGAYAAGKIPEGFQRRRARLIADFESSAMEEALNTPTASPGPLGHNQETVFDHGLGVAHQQQGVQEWSDGNSWTEPGADGAFYEPSDGMDPSYEVVPGEQSYAEMGEPLADGYYDDCDACGPCEAWSCREYMTAGHFSLFGGVQGYKGGGNLGRDGSFGFHEGVNIGLPLPLFPGTGLGCQVGFRALQSNLSSSSFTFEQRNQTFFTTGVFRRVPYGLQGGIVFDMMKDEWYDDLNLGQIRGEFGWKLPCQHEWGYYFGAGDSGDSTDSPLIVGRIDRWTPVDFHSFYYRRRLTWCPGGTARFYTGFSSDQDGLIAAESYMPFNRRWALNTSFAYLIPDESNADNGNSNESWNLSIALVWSWNGHCEYQYRPLFDVADNGSFFFRTEE